MVNLLIDTDIGDDIDDAFALLYAIRSPEINLRAITTVLDNTNARAQIALKLLSENGINDIPVYAGAVKPLVMPVDAMRPVPPQYLPETMSAIPISSTPAVEAIAGLLEDIADLEILAIGPLTNIALLIEQYPAAASKIKRIHIMGGSYYHSMNEWNIERDPETASVVFNAGIPLRLVGLDVTTRCRLSTEQVQEIRSAGGSVATLAHMMDIWISQQERDGVSMPILHDPLAVHSIINDADVQFQKEEVKIELKGEFTRGTTFIEPYRLWGGKVPDTRFDVAYNVDAPRFIQHFFRTCFAELIK
ncbi:nucleoside hydrolase [Pluralibacter gergoviae]|uniref:nucleoside hydrolase n=1 Tax=Pluralibacter gergoviae TaxID=61647 RepID=UPI001925844C|nr:nucleoside hydrolase [Pluralibacter gergoviae]MBL3694022.1 nucleoside hydrolase [Pluralibacter gergoviae]